MINVAEVRTFLVKYTNENGTAGEKLQGNYKQKKGFLYDPSLHDNFESFGILGIDIT